MGKYIHYYEAESAFTSDYNGENYLEPWVSYTEDVERVDYNKNWLFEPLTFEILSGGTLKYSIGYITTPIEYRKNGGSWTSTSAASVTEISVVAGDTVQFRGDNLKYSDNPEMYYNNNCRFISDGCLYNLKGNIMSLISSSGYPGMTEFPSLTASTYAFCYMFSSSGAVDASKLLLPANTVPGGAYDDMFVACTTLIAAPKLPATELYSNCYRNMFAYCTSLETAPDLLVTGFTLTNVTLCYNQMFRGCSNLKRIKCLIAEPGEYGTYTPWWVDGVAANGIFIKNAAATWPSGSSGIPNGWTVQDA